MKKRSQKRPMTLGIAATTTSKDWGFIPVPFKGGKTTNCNIEAKAKANKEEK